MSKIFVFSSFFKANAQDNIIFEDSSTVEAKVILGYSF
jgi:hypothetical protein